VSELAAIKAIKCH